jgi:hypothetical protein
MAYYQGRGAEEMIEIFMPMYERTLSACVEQLRSARPACAREPVPVWAESMVSQILAELAHVGTKRKRHQSSPGQNNLIVIPCFLLSCLFFSTHIENFTDTKTAFTWRISIRSVVSFCLLV